MTRRETRKGIRTNIRSGLFRRWNFAQQLKCEYIEVPADFAKSGKPLGKKAILNLYEGEEEALPEELKYILHTEPVLRGHDVLKWYDKRWLDQFANMIIFLSESLGKPASIVEIHPGDRSKNFFEDIVRSIRFLLDKYSEAFGVEPLILLENRTEQRISRGREIRDFWNFLSENHLDLKGKFGIVLDVQQLYTREGRDLEKKLKTIQLGILHARFIKAFDIIPSEAIKGFHIHGSRRSGRSRRVHQVPREDGEVPWKVLFDRIKRLESHIIINPEVLNEKWVEPTIEFCEDLLSTQLSNL